jgi:hypothetical protein
VLPGGTGFAFVFKELPTSAQAKAAARSESAFGNALILLDHLASFGNLRTNARAFRVGLFLRSYNVFQSLGEFV